VLDRVCDLGSSPCATAGAIFEAGFYDNQTLVGIRGMILYKSENLTCWRTNEDKPAKEQYDRGRGRSGKRRRITEEPKSSSKMELSKEE
jgi:hypothetical protein